MLTVYSSRNTVRSLQYVRKSTTRQGFEGENGTTLGQSWTRFHCTRSTFWTICSQGPNSTNLESPWRALSNEHVTTQLVTSFGWLNWAGSLPLSMNDDVMPVRSDTSDKCEHFSLTFVRNFLKRRLRLLPAQRGFPRKYSLATPSRATLLVSTWAV